MNYKKFLKWLMVFSVLSFLLSIALIYPEKFGLCNSNDLFSCIEPLGNFAEPFFLWSISLFITTIILLLSPETIFKTWKKFAMFYIPLSALWIITTPVYCRAGLGMCFDKEIVNWITSIGFLSITLILIIYKKFRT